MNMATVIFFSLKFYFISFNYWSNASMASLSDLIVSNLQCTVDLQVSNQKIKLKIHCELIPHTLFILPFLFLSKLPTRSCKKGNKIKIQ